jgi:hypothetical protein
MARAAAPSGSAEPADAAADEASLAPGLALVRTLRAGTRISIKKEFWAAEANEIRTPRVAGVIKEVREGGANPLPARPSPRAGA